MKSRRERLGNTPSLQSMMGAAGEDVTRNSSSSDEISQSASIFMSYDCQAKKGAKVRIANGQARSPCVYAPPWCVPTILFNSPIFTSQPLVFTCRELYQILKIIDLGKWKFAQKSELVIQLFGKWWQMFGFCGGYYSSVDICHDMYKHGQIWKKKKITMNMRYMHLKRIPNAYKVEVFFAIKLFCW